jgi:TIR domain-containing protein
MAQKSQIFLSYAYEDRNKVVNISQRLMDAGYETWLDAKNLLPGQDWEIEIRKALKDSEYVFIFLTKNSTTKEGYLQKEIKSALRIADEKPEGTIFLLPIKLEDVEVPESLKHIQWLELYRSDGWEKLLKALNANEKRKSQTYQELKSSVASIEKPKKHIFVAMPFSSELEDCYYYGIRVPINLAGFNSIRIDEASFTGDILSQIRDSIETAEAVIAMLDGANPNVYLEIGYSWGKAIPTVLLIKDTKELRFDVSGHKCLIYTNIKNLENLLTTELSKLKENGIIFS